ncbi:MAG: CRISPR-associated endonuclease Cas2 [Patescibacteria group bacterium]
MGEIEKRIKKRAKKENIQRAILDTLSFAALSGIAIAAPNALQALQKLGLIDLIGKNSNRSLYSLVKQGYVEFKTGSSGKKFLTITEKGKKKLRSFELNDFKLKKPKRWDKKWRIIIFDIKEKERKKRNELRNYLYRIGFKKLQNSVWVYPYDCEDLLMLLKADLELGRNLLYVVAEEIENDRHLREEYNLPLI